MTKNLSITALGLILGAALLKIWAIPFTKLGSGMESGKCSNS